MDPVRVDDRIFQIAGPRITGPYDCAVYLVDTGEHLTLVDAGSGFGFEKTVKNIEDLGFNPKSLGHVILTHCHFDHMGAAPFFRYYFGTKLVMHSLDAAIIARGDSRLTAAICFKVTLTPFPVDIHLEGESGSFTSGSWEFNWIHTPGHTPGSICLYLERNGERLLFGQDIGAPLLEEYDCEPEAWRASVRKLIDLDATVFLDGHGGPIYGAREIRKFLGRLAATRKITA